MNTYSKFFISGPDKTKNETISRLKKMVSHWDEFNFGDFIILNKETHDLIGFGGLHYKQKDGNPNISYIVKDIFQRNGFGIEITQTLLDYGFNQSGLEKIVAEIDPDNTSSIKLIQKCGFQKGKILKYKEYVREEYVLKRSEYQKLLLGIELTTTGNDCALG